MQTVGVIGGLGPETTAKFYVELIFSSFAKNSQQRPPILMWSVPLVYQIEHDLITKSTGEDRYLPYLTEAAQRLEQGGVDFIVMPCNSLHIFIDSIRQAVKIPVLSIVEETMAFLLRHKINDVGIIATETTLKHRLYQQALDQKRISYKIPELEAQTAIGAIIHKLVLNQHTEVDKAALITIIESLEVKTVLLACTDLQLLLSEASHGQKIYDTMKILADATVERILA